MKEFLYIFRGGQALAGSSPEVMQHHMGKWMTWMENMAKTGKYVGGQPLEGGGMVISGSKMTRTDGPYAEGKEIVGGYLIVKAADLAEAVLLSKECPVYDYEGSVEVRPIQVLNM
ncbi:MAG: YciI family protein [Bacteroidota bacterium]|nr:YciI family protein [Bacteroidota bacterium]